MPNVSLKTVYQTLHDLAELGADHRARRRDRRRLASTPTSRPPITTWCAAACGKVRDVDADFPGPAGARQGRTRASTSHSAEVVFRGLCDECQRASAVTKTNTISEQEKGTNNHASIEGHPDRGQPQGGVRRREPGQPPLPVLRPEGRRRGLPRRRRALPLGRRGRDRPRVRALRLPQRGRRPGDRRAGRRRPRTTSSRPSRARPTSTPRCTPGFAKTARDEGFEEIAEWLETLARAEKSHAGRFTQGLESLG